MTEIEQYWKGTNPISLLLTSGRKEERSFALLLTTQTSWEESKKVVEHFITRFPDYKLTVKHKEN